MKKLITLTLVLVLALGLAAPALAYTNNVAAAQGVSPYTIDIYLVEHAGGDLLTNVVLLPPTDRGYAKNEIVAAVGALTVPKDNDVIADWYRQLKFSGKNVSLNVMDNFDSGLFFLTQSTSMARFNPFGWVLNTTDNEATHLLTSSASTFGWVPTASSEKTYRWLIFGKVTDDDASMTFSLSRGATFDAIAGLAAISQGTVAGAQTHILSVNEDYVVTRGATQFPTTYFVYVNADNSLDPAPDATFLGDLLFSMETFDKGKTGRLTIFPSGLAAGTTYRVSVEPSTKELVFTIDSNPVAPKLLNDQIKFGSKGYDSLRKFYDDYVEALGFSAYNEGNILKDSDWKAIAANAWDISDTVNVEPWTPYVVVPDNIVVDPPKTGDVANLIGFALIALAGLAVVVVRKVRA